MAQGKTNEKNKKEQALTKQDKEAKQSTSKSKTSKEKKSTKVADKSAKSVLKEKDKQEKTKEKLDKKPQSKKVKAAEQALPSQKEKEAAIKVENDGLGEKSSYGYSGAKTDDASNAYTNAGNALADSSISPKEDFYASELNSPLMGMNSGVVYPHAPVAAMTQDSERGGAGSVVVLLLLATLLILFIIGIAGAGGNLLPGGSITGNNSIRYGQATTLNYAADSNADFKEGDEIVWIVEGKEVQRKSYKDKDAYSYTLKDAKVGAKKVKVVAGNRVFSETDVAVGKPLATITVNDSQYTYGEKAPSPSYSIKGLIDGDKDDAITVKSGYNDKTSVKRNAGEYFTRFYANSADNKYDVEIKQGTVTVKPKEIKISNSITKEYDGTNVLVCDDLQLSGISEGDDVKAKCDCLYFENKDAGSKKISTYNIGLVGAHAKNYVICDELQGTITPKTVTASDITVKDKAYDGKDSVEFKTAGRLDGVVRGDIVAIGDINASYENAQAGENKNIKINKINLVGKDKNNYRFITYPKLSGNIYQNGSDVVPSN